MSMVETCSPLCPFRAFVCTKKALIIRRESGLAFCAWTGDECIGYKCQFAACAKHALLPDGTCGMVLRLAEKRRSPSIEEEALKLESEYRALRDKLRRLGVDVESLE